jgi:hypothetical protein
MTYMKVTPSTTVEVPDHKNLLAAWRIHGGPAMLVARFIVRKPLTESQLLRLPEALKERLHCLDDAVDFLERLFGLEDPRS